MMGRAEIEAAFDVVWTLLEEHIDGATPDEVKQDEGFARYLAQGGFDGADALDAAVRIAQQLDAVVPHEFAMAFLWGLLTGERLRRQAPS